jgi:hypothetical protein
MTLAWLVPTRGLAQPNEGRRVVQLARGQAIAGQCALAIPNFDRAIALNPAWPDLLRDRGACHEQLGQREAAAADYRAYCDAVPTAADVPSLRQRIVALQAPIAQQPATRPVAPTPVVPTLVVPPAVAAPASPYTVEPEGSVTAPADSDEAVVVRTRGRRRERRYDEDDPRAPNSIYAEGLGAALVYSINYERLIIDDLAARVGFSYFPLSAAGISTTSIFVPITLSYIGIHSGKHALELGGGVTVLYVSGSAGGLGFNASGSGAAPLGLVMAGYRLHPLNDGGFQFRAGAMALIGEGVGLSGPNPTSIGVIPWPYLSLGWSF